MPPFNHGNLRDPSPISPNLWRRRGNPLPVDAQDHNPPASDEPRRNPNNPPAPSEPRRNRNTH